MPAGTPSAGWGCACDGEVVWYGGGKLAADLTLPKLRARWTGTAGESLGPETPVPVVRALLRHRVIDAAARAEDEAGFFARLRETGLQVRLRFSEVSPGQVTGYAVAFPGHTGGVGTPLWHGGGQLAAALTLPELRATWARRASGASWDIRAPRWAGSEREALRRHAASQVAAAAEHIQRSAGQHPTSAADTAWGAADTFHATARALHDPALRHAADTYDRAARAPHGRIPPRTRSGNQLRSVARLIALAGEAGGGSTLMTATLTAKLIDLAAAVAELRHAQQHAAQAAAARSTAERLHQALAQRRSRAAQPGWAARPEQARRATAPAGARRDFPEPFRLDQVPLDGDLGYRSPVTTVGPSRRAGPSPLARTKASRSQRQVIPRHPETRSERGAIGSASRCCCDRDSLSGLVIAENTYSIGCMAGLYEVEVEPEVRTWLAGLTDRDFGRADFLVGLLAERAEDLGEPYTRHLGGKVRELRFTYYVSRRG